MFLKDICSPEVLCHAHALWSKEPHPFYFFFEQLSQKRTKFCSTWF